MATSFVNSTKESLYMSLERIGIDITSTPDFHKNAIEYANKRFEIRNSQYKEELVEGLKVKYLYKYTHIQQKAFVELGKLEFRRLEEVEKSIKKY